MMKETEESPTLCFPRKRKPVTSVKIERSPDEWKRLIDEAKRKEVFWIKGIMPASIDLVSVSGDEDSEDDI